MMVMDIGAPGLTVVFLGVVGALTSALIGLFCALERSDRLTRLRIATMRQIDRRMTRQ